jgi:cell division protein FtsI (penicillin-binding protein 3)
MKKLSFPLLLTIILAGCASPRGGSASATKEETASIRSIVEEETAMTMESLRPKRMIAIVSEPFSGRLEAISSRRAGSRKSQSEWQEGHLEPASTFKPFIVASALESGKTKENSRIDCGNGIFTIGGKTIKDHVAFGPLTPAEILSKSSNIGSVKLALLLDDPAFKKALRNFGFEPKNDSSKADIAVGESIEISPLELAMAYGALANGGKLMKPIGMDDKPVVLRRACSAKTARIVTEAIRILPETSNPLLASPDLEAGGKAGTSLSRTATDSNSTEARWTLFAGFFPMEHPRHVCVVAIENANISPQKNYGGLVAGPVFAAIAKRISTLEGRKHH